MKTKMMNIFFITIFLVFLMRNAGSISITDINLKPILDSTLLNNIGVNNLDSQHRTIKLNQQSESKNQLFFYLILNLEIHSKTLSLNDMISPNFDNNECDIITEGPICLFNGEKIILPNARHENLIGYWNFEEIRALDNSGLRNHALNVVKSGPTFNGIGNSGYFSNGDYLEVSHTKAFEGDDFTITFWIFMIQDFFSANKGTRYCPLIQKGKDDLSSKSYSRFPAIFFDRKEKFIQVFLKTKTQNSKNIEGEFITSNSKINNQKWMHISLVKKNKQIKLYINGILDNTLEVSDTLQKNSENIFIGGTPWLKEECNYSFLMDELRYYNSDINESLIMAEASPALGGIEPNYINLGCVNCSLQTASKSCKDKYRLCSPIELHTGGYQVARNMGWLNWNTHIWTYSALQSPKVFEKFKGLAICCLENK